MCKSDPHEIRICSAPHLSQNASGRPAIGGGASARAHKPPKANKVSDKFGSIDVAHSGPWVEELVGSYSRIKLFSLAYDVLWVDGSLNWSRITAASEVGLLYEPGMRVALFQVQLADRRRAQRLRSARSRCRLATLCNSASR